MPVDEVLNESVNKLDIIPENYIKISIPLKLMVPHTIRATKISIHNNKNKVICREAYLVGKQNHSEDTFNNQLESKYKVLIHSSDLVKVMALKNSSFWAFPFNHIVNSNKKRNLFFKFELFDSDDIK